MARGLFRPYLKVSIRHAFKVPVHFDPDLIATEGETFPSGSVATGRKPSELLLPPTTTSTKAAALEGDGGLGTKSQSEPVS
ncbi:hypothetical protein [Mesorhizobium temperatum]|uniref:hypothetical protein n=1 Tax=Mesorhizobium temperatum TaxID=241416 RepID=UPI00142D6244|nr:hypothetical protein [Mesorhizobium temperatum]